MQKNKVKAKKVKLAKKPKGKSEIKKSKEVKVVLSSKEKIKLRLTESKIKKLLDVEHLEELLHLLHLLNDKQIILFMQHYLQNKVKAKDSGIDRIIKKSKTPEDLVSNLSEELINSLKKDYEDSKERISEIRKKGLDVYVEDLKLMSVPLKIKMFQATEGKDDYYKIKKIIFDVGESLKIKEKELERKKKLEEKVVKKVKVLRKAVKRKGKSKKVERKKVEKVKAL